MKRCALLPCLLCGCISLEEQRTPYTEVFWRGVVLDGPDSEDAEYFSGGTFVLTTPDGEAVAEAEEEQGNEGWWELTVPVDIAVVIRLAGDGFANTVWQARTPKGPAYWYHGALYARTQDAVASFFGGLDDLGLLASPAVDLSTGEVAHFIGLPLLPEDWVGATCALTDGADQAVEVLALALAEDGSLYAAAEGDPVVVIVAANLSPGPVALEVQAADGRALTLDWTAEGGDLLNADFLTLPESE